MELVWVWSIIGFLFAAYSVIANDGIQTLGTFIASNRKVKWQYLWLFAATILVATLTYSWVVNGGDISHGRLEKIPYIEIQWYHALAPLVLIALTRFGIPVSTSLLVLSAFASTLVFEKILIKSAMGYVLAAVLAYALWVAISRWDSEKNPVKPEHERFWRVAQWFATGFLWYTWLSHDMANIAVFLPRELDVIQLLGVLAVFVIGLAFVFRERGGKIQEIVLQKSNTTYVRSATIIDSLYAVILVFFKGMSSIPMSTTWVFIGLLSGRELAIAMMDKQRKTKDIFPLVGKDMSKLLFGLFVSIVIALLIQNIDQVTNMLTFWL